MEIEHQATRLWGNFFHLRMPQIRAFHLSWFSFFLCFFAWFGIAPLMPVVRAELGLTHRQVGWTLVASVAMTIVARLVIGWLCEFFGPRLTFSGLLIFGAFPVIGIAFAHDFGTFILFRLMIGMIGASFVITQYHMSTMFAPNIVGTANATSAGWGNMGGGATQIVMPLLFASLLAIFGWSESTSWRASMVLIGLLCVVTGIAYFRFTQDAPDGNFRELRALGKLPSRKAANRAFFRASADYRVWALFVAYAACFGMELTINNMAALYFVDYFGLSMVTAGAMAGSFGLMNLFARSLGGTAGDKFGSQWGLHGRAMLLFVMLFCEGIALMFFSQMTALAAALPALIAFSLFVQVSEGATFSIVPFVNKQALGAVAGIVGAGGNAGALAAGFLLKESTAWPATLLGLGTIVTLASFLALSIRFPPPSPSPSYLHQS